MKKNELKELVKEEIQNIINEFDIKDGNDDNEGEMSKSELLYIADKAGKIAEKITADDQPIEAWAQSHISAAKELISHVADYVGYGEEEAGEEGTEEIEDNEEAGQEVDSKSIVEPDGLNEVQSEKQKAAFAKMLAAKNPKKKSKEEPNKPKEEKEKKELKEEKSKEQMSLDMTLAKLDDAGKAEYLKKFDAASKKALSGNTEELALLIATQQLGQLRNEVKEEPKKELKVKKLQADKFKEDIKDLAAKNEHGKILQLIKKLEQYVKTHKSKGEN